MKIEKINKQVSYITTKRKNFINIDETNEIGDSIEIKCKKGEQLTVFVNSEIVYQSIPDNVLIYPKNIWELLSQTKNWEIEDNIDNGFSYKNFYFYNQYGEDITVLFNKNGSIAIRVDYLDIDNIKDYHSPKVIENSLLEEMKDIQKEILNICSDNDLSLEHSHYMETVDGVDCWKDILLEKDKKLNLDALNYIFLLLDKLNTIYQSIWTSC